MSTEEKFLLPFALHEHLTLRHYREVVHIFCRAKGRTTAAPGGAPLRRAEHWGRKYRNLTTELDIAGASPAFFPPNALTREERQSNLMSPPDGIFHRPMEWLSNFPRIFLDCTNVRCFFHWFIIIVVIIILKELLRGDKTAFITSWVLHNRATLAVQGAELNGRKD